MSENSFTHFYLYSKYYYKRSKNVLADLKEVAKHYLGINAEHIHPTSVLHILVEIVMFEIERRSGYENYRSRLADFTLRLFSVNGSVEQAISECLGWLSTAQVKDLNLGKPDSSILPLNPEGI